MNETNKPSLKKEDYPNLYEYRRQWLSTFEKDDDMDTYPKSISFFCKSGDIPVSGVVFKPPQPEFSVEYDIKQCFGAIKDKMTRKDGKLRAEMLKLKEYEIQAWSQLLDYLRYEWGSLNNREKVLLTKSEWFMLFGKDKGKTK